MSFLIPLLYFIFANGFFVLIFKKSFGKCIPFTMMVCAFTYFFSQVLFSTFKIGFFLNLSYAFLFFLLLFLKKKEKKEIKENLFSRGFYAFLILYCILFFFDLNRSFEAWDEYSHWGEMVKEMFRLDQFYSISKSSLQAHKDYPPIMQLLELFFCMLKGGFKESYLVQCMHLFSFSFFIPIIDKKDFPFKKSFVIKVVLTLLSFYLILLSFDQHGIINTIYTDYIMAIIVSYLLFYIFSEKELLSSFSLLLLSIGCSFLVLLKHYIKKENYDKRSTSVEKYKKCFKSMLSSYCYSSFIVARLVSLCSILTYRTTV